MQPKQHTAIYYLVYLLIFVKHLLMYSCDELWLRCSLSISKRTVDYPLAINYERNKNDISPFLSLIFLTPSLFTTSLQILGNWTKLTLKWYKDLNELFYFSWSMKCKVYPSKYQTWISQDVRCSSVLFTRRTI